MIGYHYTDARNLPRILKQGLIPYPCPKTNTDLWGVMVFKKRQTGSDLVGCVLWQMSQKAATSVVELRVKYDASYSFSSRSCVVDRWPAAAKRSIIDFTHSGNIDKFLYHVPPVPVDCILAQIPPDKIKHLATYKIDAIQIWRSEK